MPILPGIEQVRGDYDAVFGVGFPFTIFSYAALRTARAAAAPLVLTPFLHLATPGDPVNRSYTRPHQVRLLAAADLIVVPTELEAGRSAAGGSTGRGSSTCRWPSSTPRSPAATVRGSAPGSLSRRTAHSSASSARSIPTRGRPTSSAPSAG